MPILKADTIKALADAAKRGDITPKEAHAMMMLDEFVSSLPTKKELQDELAKMWPANIRDLLSEQIIVDYTLLNKKQLAERFKKAVPDYEKKVVVANAFEK